MRDKRSFTKGLLLLWAIVFFLAEVATFYWGMVYSGHGLAKLRVIGAEKFATVRTEIFGIDDELRKLKDEVYPLVKDKHNNFQKALTINEWVINQISGTGGGDLARSKRTPYAILLAMREGKTGASCGYRALLYLAALKSLGIESRMVSLAKSNKVDTHATVEVLIDKQWVVIDPTFGVYFVISGKPASAVELHQLLLRSGNNLEVIKGREALGSVKFDSPDYLLAFFHNVSVYERRHFFAWQALPIVQYFFGVAVAHLENENGITENVVKVHNLGGLAYNFIFPFGFAVSIIAFAIAVRWQRQRSNRN